MASARRPKALADGSENFARYPAASSLRSRSGYFGGVGCCGELHCDLPKGYAHGSRKSRGRWHDQVGKMLVKDQGDNRYSDASGFQSHEARMPDNAPVS